MWSARSPSLPAGGLLHRYRLPGHKRYISTSDCVHDHTSLGRDSVASTTAAHGTSSIGKVVRLTCDVFVTGQQRGRTGRSEIQSDSGQP